VTPAPLARLAPHIILRSNLALFSSYLASSSNEADSVE
jgi:hypothetical protein